MRAVVLLIAISGLLPAGPVDFGMAELQRAIEARGLSPSRFRFKTGITTDAPDAFRVAPGLITGGSLRGIMYGLLDAAEQIRLTGRVRIRTGKPAAGIRGIRQFLHNADLEKEWYYSRDYWEDFFRMLARNRFNRFNLVFAHQTDYLAPPYPYWVEVEEFPGVRVPGLSADERRRNLEMLRFISDTAAEYGIDFTLGIWEHNVQRGMKPSVEGLTPDNIGPYSYAALRKVLAACPGIRSVQMRTNEESGIPRDRQVSFYRDHVFRAIRDAGRRVTLDLRAWSLAGGMIDAARDAGVPLRVSTKYWAEFLGRPYQPAETFRGYSYMNLLERGRPYEFFWEVWALGSHRLLLWGDPEYVRRAAPTFSLSGSEGFEIDAPLAQKGFGNRPGAWGIFANSDRVFWKWDFERYWLWYLLWGRLSYDPKTSERVWLSEMETRFGTSAKDVLEAYQAASGVLNEIVAAHMPDPNMYVWPEINPGGVLDEYRGVRPSDWRFIANAREAVHNRLQGIASAKQTPGQTAAILEALAGRIDGAIERARAKLPAANREWPSTEADFIVLAHLARYHAHKQIAAEQVTLFDETGDAAALERARSEIAECARVWESLVKHTDGLYPAEMAFGPDDTGHWRDKLPYVRYDARMVEERRRVFERFGQFEYGFDFGGSAVAPRFRATPADTLFSEKTGYGWTGEGERRMHAIEPAPRLELRSVAHEPKHLPENTLYGDWIEGRGPQIFRIRAGDGEFTALIVDPQGSVEQRQYTARNGCVDVQFPDGEWKVSAVIIRGNTPSRRIPPASKPAPRPRMTHTPPRSYDPARPLTLSLRVIPAPAGTIVRLHYRPLDQLAEFKSLEAPAAKATFTIPPEDTPARFDLMYYFEVLNAAGGGWFEPDPHKATPYYVIAPAAQ